MKIKICSISDTHRLHDKWLANLKSYPDIYKEYLDSDILLHSGDISSYGYKTEIIEFLDWFSKQPQQYKIFIAGNHDFFLDTKYKACTEIGKRRHQISVHSDEEVKELIDSYPNITYLNETSTSVYGLKIYGTPITPWFHDWAFNRTRVNGIELNWHKIPKDTDILLVHGPPHKVLDKLNERYIRFGEDPYVGCEILARYIKEISPKLVQFGHIHEGYGSIERDGIIYVNASSVNIDYRPINLPIFTDIQL